MNDESCTISTVDFKARTVRENRIVDHDTGIPQTLRSMADYAVKNNVEAVLVVTIETGNACYHYSDIRTEAQASLMALYLEDVREELKDKIFNEGEEDGGE